MYNKDYLKKHINDYIDFYAIGFLLCAIVFKLTLFEKYINIREISFVFIISIWSFIKMFFIQKRNLRIGIHDIFIIIFFLFLITHFVFLSRATLYYSRLWVYIYSFLLLFLFSHAFTSRSKLKLKFTFYLLVLFGFHQALLALIQYLGFLEVDIKYFTVVGSFLGPNFLGLYLVFGLIILVWLFSQNMLKKKWEVAIGLVLIIFLIIILILTESRGSWLALSFALVFLASTSKEIRKRIKLISTGKKLILSIVFCIGISLLGRFIYTLNSESITGRLFITKIASNEVLKKPLLGHGLFSFTEGYNRTKSEYFLTEKRDWSEIKVANYVNTAFNDYVLVSYEFGVLFVIVFLIIIGGFFLKAIRTPETIIALALLTSILIWSLFNSIFSTPIFMFIGVFSFAVLIKHGIKPYILITLPKSISKILVTFVLVVFSGIGMFFVTSKLYAANKIENNLKDYKLIDSLPISQLKKLAPILDNNTVSDFNIGSVLYSYGHKEEGIQFMESSFGKTLKPDIGRKLVKYHLKEGNFDRAKEIYKLNSGIEPFRYEPLINLINIHESLNDYEKVVCLAQKVIDMRVKIPSKKVDDYKKSARKKIEYYLKHIDTTSLLKGTLSKTLYFKSDILIKKLMYKVYLPPLSMIHEKLPVVYINDGSRYTKNGAVHILDSLISDGKINPAAAVFLEPRDGYKKYNNVRQELFLCNTNFANFFSKEFIPHIEYLYPVGGERNKRTIMGRSFGGLAAAYLASKKPQLFKNIVMQSPAFKPCPEIYNIFPKNIDIDFKIYLSYGTGKDTERQSLKMKTNLIQKGYTFKLNVVENGNHDWKLWKPQLKEIYTYLYPKTIK